MYVFTADDQVSPNPMSSINRSLGASRNSLLSSMDNLSTSRYVQVTNGFFS